MDPNPVRGRRKSHHFEYDVYFAIYGKPVAAFTSTRLHMHMTPFKTGTSPFLVTIEFQNVTLSAKCKLQISENEASLT